MLYKSIEIKYYFDKSDRLGNVKEFIVRRFKMIIIFFSRSSKHN